MLATDPVSLENIMLNEKVWLLRVLGPAVCKVKEKGIGDVLYSVKVAEMEMVSLFL